MLGCVTSRSGFSWAADGSSLNLLNVNISPPQSSKKFFFSFFFFPDDLMLCFPHQSNFDLDPVLLCES